MEQRDNTLMVRLGLCCTFHEQPIKFRTATATALNRLERSVAIQKLSALCLHNASALRQAIGFCTQHGIGAFRVTSQILPLKTHPAWRYDVAELPEGQRILDRFLECGRVARDNNVRLSFHPDQFIVLNSPRADVVINSLAELEYQAEVAEWIGADVINLHAGGAYGDKAAALDRLEGNLERLSPRARFRLTLENDDGIYTPTDLLPLCRRAGVPLVYDVHHHRCCGDGCSVEEATELALATWSREPLFHISSPLNGWDGPQPHRHHDYIHPADFPDGWLNLNVTIDVEAKAKELAVRKLQADLAARLR